MYSAADLAEVLLNVLQLKRHSKFLEFPSTRHLGEIQYVQRTAQYRLNGLKVRNDKAGIALSAASRVLQLNLA